MANGLQGLGLALSGFGAGVQGQLPQFQQSLADAEAQRETQRKQQLAQQYQARQLGAQTMQGLVNLMDAGNTAGAVEFIMRSGQAFDQIGTPNPFADVVNDVSQGNMSSFNELAESARRNIPIAIEEGLLPRPEQKDDPVQTSVPLSGGGFSIVRKSGKSEVVRPGEADIELIKVAEERANQLAAERAGGRAAATGKEKLKTERGLNAIISDRAKGTTLAKGEADRLSDYISNGLKAVEQVPTINRGLELLNKINTGGLTAASKVVTDFFGVTGGDIGELNNILGQRVVDGLQQFSGAISEGEREFIRRIETDIARGKASNIAILKRGLDILKRKINRARKAAEVSNDDFALSVLDNPEGFAFNKIKPVSSDGVTPDATQTQRLRYNPETGKVEPIR